MMTALLILFGLILLVLGAELLVRGASRLAALVGISPLIIGLTVVAFGTSAPELAVSVSSALSGKADIALGNVVGSNIFNILFILGLSALVMPLVVHRQLIRLDVPIMIGISLLTWIFARDGLISGGEGSLLFLGIVAYTLFLIQKSRKENKNLIKETKAEIRSASSGFWGKPIGSVLRVVIGLFLLAVGARWLVEGASTLARHFGVSELIIGLTIVAAGTSLPEAATSIVATLRGERDIAVGNAVGSSIFNILAVLGFSSMISLKGIYVSSEAMDFDIPFMVITAIFCLPVFFSGGRISRWEGGLFLFLYTAYTVFLAISSIQPVVTYQGLFWGVSVLALILILLSLFYDLAFERGEESTKN